MIMYQGKTYNIDHETRTRIFIRKWKKVLKQWQRVCWEILANMQKAVTGSLIWEVSLRRQLKADNPVLLSKILS